MKVAEIPNHFNANMTTKEFDALLQGWRIYVRDYEVGEVEEGLLAALEEAGVNREVGGNVEWTPPGWDGEAEEPPQGGQLVPA